MSKNLKRVIALVLVLAVCISSFAMLTVQGEGEFKATITGWASNIDQSYTWFTSISEVDKAATREAMVDELEYQNNVLGFKIGTPDNAQIDENGLVIQGGSWPISTDWGTMVVSQIENKNKEITDNTSNPWGTEGRYMGFVIAPFPSMAFTVKGDRAGKYSAMGDNPALSNEFIADGETVQVLWKNYTIGIGDGIATVDRFPGSNGGVDVTNNMFRYAVAKYNQDNKHNARGTLHAGYPTGNTTTTKDNTITYQELQGSVGTALIAVNTKAIRDGKLQGAYVIPDSVVSAMLSKIAPTLDECFAVTGAPIEDASGGKQRFENGVVSSLNGFQASSCDITSFTFAGSDIPADIDTEAGTITAYVNSSANLSSLEPTIAHNGKSVSPEGKQDFSKAVKYTVTAESGDTKTFTVNVKKLTDTEIVSFTVYGVEATIDRENGVITALVDSADDLKTAAPVIKTVGTGTTVTPASGAAVDLSTSWENGVTYKVTKGSESTTYTIKVRNKSNQTSITKFNIPEGSLKYQTLNGEVVGDIRGSAITLNYEAYNAATSSVAAVVELSDGATISPDPLEARPQNNTQYTVTAEDGKTTRVYTVTVNVATDGKIGPAKIEMTTNNTGSRFGSEHSKELAMEAIQAEYNNQRVNFGYDPGTPSGSIENWNDVFVRQFFDGGTGTQDIQGHSGMITMDVPEGRAYTIKGDMLRYWQQQGTDEDGNTNWLFSLAGGAAVNEFKMDGYTYQQFSGSYGRSGQGITMYGIGSYYNRHVEALKDSYYYYQPNQALEGDIAYSFRKAYEYANILNHNPGVALDGNFNVIRLATDTDEVIKEIETLDSKGRREFTTTKEQWPNFVMYQVFSGSGETDATTRDSSNKTVIVKGGNINGVDHGGALAVYDGPVKKMYEAIPGEKELLEFKSGNGGTGDVVMTMNYNVTLGTPTFFGLTDEGDLAMEFASDSIELNDEGEEEMVTEYFYFTAPIDDPTNITRHEGTRLSNNNRIASVDVGVEGAEIDIINGGDLVFPETSDPEDPEAFRFTNTAIAINFPAGTELTEEFLTNFKFKSVTLEDEKAYVSNPEIPLGSTEIPAIDCSVSGSITITAENNGARSYLIWLYVDGESYDSFQPEWGSWYIEPEKPIEYEWNEGFIVTIDGVDYYGTDPNAHLKDADGQPLWIYQYGYYTNGIEDDSHWNPIDVPADWNPADPVNGWRVYCIEHGLAVQTN